MTSVFEQFSEAKLTLGEEAVLVYKIKAGDEDALNALVMANMREALKYSQRVSYDRIDEPTRVSLCYQEMMMSGRRFIPGGIRFFAFAKAGLRGRMKTYWTSLNAVRNAGEIFSLDARVPDFWDEKNRASVREKVTGEMEEPKTNLFVAKDHWQTIRRELSDELSDQQ